MKKSRIGLFGPTLYNVREIHKTYETAKALALLFPDSLLPQRQTDALLAEVLRQVGEIGGARLALLTLLAVAGALIVIGGCDLDEAHQLLDAAAVSMSRAPKVN